MVQSADQRPGADGYERHVDARKVLEAHLGTLERLLKEELPAVEAELRASDIPYITASAGR
jgi:hypothetical protein